LSRLKILKAHKAIDTPEGHPFRRSTAQAAMDLLSAGCRWTRSDTAPVVDRMQCQHLFVVRGR